MKKIGLTGGIGSGKTYISYIFSALDIPIFYSDDVAKDLVNNSQELRESINNLYAENLFPGGILDKKRLSHIIFSNNESRIKLNELIHPMVNVNFKNWLTKQNSRYIIKEAAILFESNSYLDLDKIICVSSSVDLRIKRVIDRSKMKESEVRNIMDHQISDVEIERKSDYVIINNQQDLLLPQIIKLHNLFIS